MSGAGAALFALMHDHAHGTAEEAHRFYDFDHVPDRLSCSGWREAQRFARVDAPADVPGDDLPRWTEFLYMHAVDSLDALTSPARHAFDEGSPWARARAHAGTGLPSRALRTGWRRRASPWLGAISYRIPPPRALFVVLYDIAPAHVAAVDHHVEGEVVPELLSCPGFLHCERFEAGPPLTPVPGSEGLTQPDRMDVYDLASAEVLSGGGFTRWRAGPSPRSRALAGSTTVRGAGAYVQRPSPWLIETWTP
ncbi:hypothetical protein [Pseudonocardia sp. GCM10023141]|uniref:hypothetical protein n=1 Tax=Pseudonocardia sp. GCM10023141 TaxID=3252653 RepID=UPI00360993A5